jgi:uncharacterized protein
MKRNRWIGSVVINEELESPLCAKHRETMKEMLMAHTDALSWRAKALRGVIAGLAIAVGLALALGPKTGVARADSTPNGITVTGSGTTQLPPDQAEVSGNVETQASTANDALNQNSQTMQAVLAAVKGFGFADSDIKTNRVSVYPVFSSSNSNSPNASSTPTIIGYKATNGVTVKVRDLSQVGDLIQGMVSAGVNDFTGVQFELQNPEQIRQMALQAAISDAQAGAQTSATALGVGLGGVLNMTTQSQSAGPVPYAPPPPSPAALREGGAAPPPIQPGPLSATANVTVTYAILGH